VRFILDIFFDDIKTVNFSRQTRSDRGFLQIMSFGNFPRSASRIAGVECLKP